MTGDWAVLSTVVTDSSTVTNGLTIGDSIGYTYPLTTWGWWPGGCSHYHWTTTEPHEHDFAQAAAPFEATLFCRKCGDTKQLKLPKAKRSQP